MASRRESWKIKDEAILAELVGMLKITDAERAMLGGLREQARAAAPAMADAFYTRILAHPQTAEFVKDSSMGGLHTTMIEWFCALFSGSYDEAYTRQRLTIGQVHVRIGLPVRYPLAMLDIVAQHGEPVARQASDPAAAVAAFRKVLALDVAIFNQAYEDNQLKHLSELVGGENLARLLLTGGA